MRRVPPLISPFTGHKIPYPILTVSTGLFLYALGSTLAYVSRVNFLRHSWYMILVISGFVWVASVLCWAFANYETVLTALEPSLDISSEGFRRLVDGHLRQVYTDRVALFLQGILVPIGVTYVLLTAVGYYWVPEIVRQEILLKPLMLAYFLLITVLLILVGVNGMAKIIQHMDFVWRLSRIPIRLSVLRIRTKTNLNELARFSLLSSLTWNVGLAMMTPIFFSVLNPFIESVFAISLAIGISFFLLPQLQLHQAIAKAKSKLGEEIMTSTLDLKPRDYVKALSLTISSQHIEKINDWCFDVNTVLKQAVSVGIPIVTYLIQILPSFFSK